MNPNRRKQILIVEDMINWHDALSNILGDIYELTITDNFDEAIASLRVTHFDLAILDIRLEDENEFNVQGIELLKIIREIHQNTRVIILTGYPQVLRQQTLERYKPDAFLKKVPLDIDLLKQAIKELIENKAR